MLLGGDDQTNQNPILKNYMILLQGIQSSYFENIIKYYFSLKVHFLLFALLFSDYCLRTENSFFINFQTHTTEYTERII